MTQPIPANVETIYQDIRQLIEAAKGQVVSQINQTLVLTYWQIGKRIKTEVLQDERAQYGAGIIKQLSAQLTRDYGNGFSHSSLTRMAKFYAYLPEQAIVATLSQQLSWSHFVELIKIEDELKRNFYVRLCSDAHWPVRTLRERMDSMLYERTVLSKQADMNRQKRIQIAGSDYYIALLFYHRKLRRLVLIELKLGEFKAEYKGQVELYLKWLAKYEQQAGEQSPIAIILCSGKDTEVVELMDLEPDNIHVAEYWLKLPPKEVLQAKLHKAMIEAKARLEFRRGGDGDE